MSFPMLAVELFDRDLADRSWLQTSYVDAVAVRVRPWDVERLHAASLAEEMLSDAGVKSIVCEMFRALNQ